MKNSEEKTTGGNIIESSTQTPKTIILINPHYHRNWQYGIDAYSFPIGLLYLGTVLKNAGFNPVILDACVDENYLERIVKLLPDTLYVGISVMTPQVPHGLEIARYIRRLSPKIPLVWGGIHPTLYPVTVLHDCCDIVVSGEGEITATELARMYSSGGDIDLSTIESLSLESDNLSLYQTPPHKLIPMDDLPWVDYTLIDAEKYIYTWSLQELRMVRVIPVHAARGCPWHCTFCINTTINSERRYRYRGTEDMLDEIEHLVTTYKLEMIILSDEEFFADRQRVESFLDGLEKRNLSHIRFNATCRVNHFRNGYIDAAFLKRLKQCGFVNLVFGFESGSQDCLEIIRKEITVDMGLHAARLLASEGFMAVWGFIMAIPGETRKDLIKTLLVMEKIRRMSRKNYFIGPQIFRPYPGSELYREALKSGLAEPVGLEEWGSQEFTGEGWIGSSELLWIKPEDRALVDYVNYIGPVYYNHQFLNISGLAKLFHKFLRLIFRFRLATNMWLFPVEHKIRKIGKAKLKT
ncbi:B12-binding domain-containing radical SAM protein [bacterium]|nr:B12-binding domain-containing radical SAM protein [bacterium]